MKKVIIAGGTGFIGSFFVQKWRGLGYDVKMISRRDGHISWDDRDGIVENLEGAELLINLAGKSVNCRYNDKAKREIMDSRIKTTTILGESIEACAKPPELWVNSSTATIYRHAEDRPMTEEGGEIGTGFSVDVASNWENAFFQYHLKHTRQIALRIAIVLGRDGGVMTPYRHMVTYGLGGAQGKGTQMFSWIHIEDLFRIIRFLQKRKDLQGIFNCSAPEPVTNRELMQKMRKAMNARFSLPAPEWMLKMGAIFIQTETELVLKSRWVLPKRLEDEGYTFAFRNLDATLEDIV
ncbi:TIGR01777 family oxidoreductase [Bacillus sp. 1P06AnD]|uniref:TIGR01777 family oxidoreductase n=1 Tax=Bacillus sp. 1P06AnD TaxID=3132208 RepID=UPI0039A37B7F